MARRTSRRRWLAIVSVSACLPVLAWAQTVPSVKPARVAVASREIARGVVLSAADIGYTTSARANERGGTSSAPSVIEPALQADSLVGWQTRRLIGVGEPLRAPAVAPPQMVKSGDLVTVVYEADGVAVTMKGRATRSAAVGERLVVRLDNQRKLEGTVVGAGRVRVN